MLVDGFVKELVSVRAYNARVNQVLKSETARVLGVQ